MYAPTSHDEITGLTHYIDQQLDALRASVHGLTEEQAKSTPCASSLSLAALLKHAAYGMRGYVAQLSGSFSELDDTAFAAYLQSLEVGSDEKVSDVLAEFDSARAELRAALAHTDPDADAMAPPAPWHGIMQSAPVKRRYDIVHFLEEFARHAGHADIIREQLDGMAIPALVMSIEGMPASQFFQPYVPAPGTIGAA
ncbi:MAG TPA: DUF664 domain-containing protein [Flexivirga sp.]|uniref:mycothiol transferase n=1 Tax=Flexivirga sp. TaxID=1962927 RepID=UPI002CFF09F2|nr:DUF664 domain-containing protein [Flexivirga sp.]HWC23182.1 DUF664 domain-containing protein [Flexivirga sp.]